MNKLLNSLSLLVAVGLLSTLAGCDLYFHDHGDGGNDSWNYCGSDGLYQCQGDNCEWVSSTCPDNTGSGSSMGSNDGSGGSGYECSSNTQCAAGCYCTASGTCEEGGFCATDADCGSGYHCDTARSSCEPNPPGCTADSCTNGQVCDSTSGQCTSGSCAVDTTITCTTAAPVCAVGQVPSELNGCFTGSCQDTAACTSPASCNFINDEDNCLARATDCSASYTGLDCTNTGGTACHSGDAGCTCASFEFASCENRTGT
jgi:hypothetical protein